MDRTCIYKVNTKGLDSLKFPQTRQNSELTNLIVIFYQLNETNLIRVLDFSYDVHFKVQLWSTLLFF
jgi:hypothetical protein